MTNYEWLVGTEKLKEFIASIIGAEDSNGLYVVEDTWKIPRTNCSFHSIEISNWLQAEHKEPDVYVKLEEIINTVSTILGMQNDIFGVSLAVKCENTIRDLIKREKIHIKTFEEE